MLVTDQQVRECLAQTTDQIKHHTDHRKQAKMHILSFLANCKQQKAEGRYVQPAC